MPIDHSMQRTFSTLTFPALAIILSAVAIYFSEIFSAAADSVIFMLALVMFLMGLTLDKRDFVRIREKPVIVFIGVLLQFSLMPLIAVILSYLLQLPNQLTAGMVLVGSCAGGTASNVMTYLAKGDLALSISMTIVSTLVGVIATPLLCEFYLSETLAVDSIGMVKSIIQLVFIPVFLGVCIKAYAAHFVLKIEKWIPSLSMLCILFIIATVVALNSDRLSNIGFALIAAVILHNSLGLFLGYYVSRLLGLNLRQSKTVAIEVGMQNSGLGVTLALQFFSPSAAVPGALFSLWHNISGSILASLWGKENNFSDSSARSDEN